MTIYLMSQGFEALDLVVTRYSTIANPPTDIKGIKLEDNNDKAMNAILSGIVCFEFMKVM